MREIKFRAWDERNKRMWYSHEFGESEGEEGFFYNFDENGFKMFMLREDPYNQYNPALRRDLPSMQFTGLHDRNGTEIYEGDVFQVKLLDDEMEYYTEKGVVIFEDGSFWIAKPSLNSNNEITYEFLSDVSDMHFSEIEDEFIRLGTIYENPELLEATE